MSSIKFMSLSLSLSVPVSVPVSVLVSVSVSVCLSVCLGSFSCLIRTFYLSQLTEAKYETGEVQELLKTQVRVNVNEFILIICSTAFICR